MVFAVVGAPAPAGAIDPADDQFETVKVKGAGISLDVPSNWLRVDPSKKEWAKSFDQVADANPEFEELLTAAKQNVASGHLKLYAVDPGPVQGGTNNVNVSIGDGVLLARAQDYEAMLRRSLPDGWDGAGRSPRHCRHAQGLQSARQSRRHYILRIDGSGLQRHSGTSWRSALQNDVRDCR